VPQASISFSLDDDPGPSVKMTCSYSGARRIVSVDLLFASSGGGGGAGELILRCLVGSPNLMRHGIAQRLKSIALDDCSDFDSVWALSGAANVKFLFTKYNDSLRGAYTCRFNYFGSSGLAVRKGGGSLRSAAVHLRMTGKRNCFADVTQRGRGQFTHQ